MELNDCYYTNMRSLVQVIRVQTRSFTSSDLILFVGTKVYPEVNQNLLTDHRKK